MHTILLLFTTIFWQIMNFFIAVGGHADRIVKNLVANPNDRPQTHQLITLPAAIHNPSNQKLSYVYQHSNSGVTFTAQLGNDEIFAQNGEVYLLITLEADDWDQFSSQADQETIDRKPLNIALVVDRSGSMSGEKLSYVKKALIDIADYLTPKDYLSLVIYDSKAETVLEPQHFDRQKFVSAVEQINSKGGTYLEGGLRKGLKHVAQADNNNYLNRVILLSDGLANVGVDSPEGLVSIIERAGVKSTNISTIGVGADYDERLMTAVAKAGRGNYYFMESPTQAAQIFSKEFDSLTQMVATQLNLDFNLNKDVTIEQAIAYDYQGGDSFKPYNLAASAKTSYLFALKVNGSASRVIDLANLKLSFYSEIDQSYQQIELPLVASITNNQLNPLADPIVYEEYMNSYLAENLMRVYEQLDGHQNKMAEEQLDEVYKNVQQANSRLPGKFDSQIKEIESKQKFVLELEATYVKDSSGGKIFQKSMQSEFYRKVYNK